MQIHPLNRKIKELMQSNKVSQKDCASTLGVTQGALNQRLNSSNPLSIDQLCKLSSFLKVSPLSILSESMPTEFDVSDSPLKTVLNNFKVEVYSKLSEIGDSCNRLEKSIADLSK